MKEIGNANSATVMVDSELVGDLLWVLLMEFRRLTDEKDRIGGK